MAKKIGLGILCSAFLCTAAFAQTAVQRAGTLVYAEGDEFSISRGTTVTSYSAAADDVLGLAVREGDVIFTEAATFLEIELLPSRSVLKVAENTTFQLKKAGSRGQNDIEVIYGRVRAKVAKMTGTQSFSVRGQNAVAGVRGTDFGFDVVSERGAGKARPLTNVYCFEGTVEVTPLETAPATGEPKTEETAAEPVVIKANEMVTIASPGASDESGTPAGGEEPGVRVVKTEIGNTIVDFWTEKTFKSPRAIALGQSAPTVIDQKPAAQDNLSGPADSGPAVTPDAPELAVVTPTGPGSETVPEERQATPGTPADLPVELTEKQLQFKNDTVFAGISLLATGALVGSGGLGIYFYEPASGKSKSLQTVGTALLTCAGTLLVTGAVALVRGLFVGK